MTKRRLAIHTHAGKWADIIKKREAVLKAQKPEVRIVVKRIFFRRKKIKMRRVVENVVLAEENNISINIFKCGENLFEHRQSATLERHDDIFFSEIDRFKRNTDNFQAV